jgi:hypothetical protein
MKDIWNFICTLDDIIPYSGVAALIDGKQIAVFRTRSITSIRKAAGMFWRAVWWAT